MKQNLAWIDGAIIELANAQVPLEDRAYLLGDGIYEVVRFYDGCLFYLEAHLNRMENSAAAIRLNLPRSRAEITAAAEDLVRQSGFNDGYLYLQATRGSAKRDQLFPADTSPALIMYVRELAPLSPIGKVKPINLITLQDERWLNCHIKTINLLPNLLARQKAFEAGAAEAVLYRPGEIVTEGTRSNIFALVDGVIRTHPANNLILPGISRSIVIGILNAEGVPCREEAMTIAELKRAAELWVTSTTMEVNPVQRVDSYLLPKPVPGPVCLKLMKAFRSQIAESSNRRRQETGSR